MLRHIRSVLVRAPHVRLHQLRRLDDRIAAHLDGLAVAGAYGTALCTAALERPGVGEVFALAVRAIDERDDATLDRLLALAAALPDAQRGLKSALGWVSAAQLQGIVQALLLSDDPLRREIGIAACRLHGADPGTTLLAALRSDAPALRAEALRAAGELGRADALAPALAALSDADASVALEAARTACPLGDRGASLQALEAIAQREGPQRERASTLLLLAVDFEPGRQIVRRIAQGALPEGVTEAARKRRVVRACALLGDARFVPWLVEQMADDALARLAGESFALISGADLAALNLERKPPQVAPGAPNDDPADDNVALDEDDSLPWPDRERVLAWWAAHAAQMPADARCFMGAAPSPAHCTQMLREGQQRQRIVAAQLRCLLAPGGALFATSAPAWRQKRRLDAE